MLIYDIDPLLLSPLRHLCADAAMRSLARNGLASRPMPVEMRDLEAALAKTATQNTATATSGEVFA
jgi:hypothetical protein